MLCSKCGKQIQDDMSFCPYCGAEAANRNKPETANSKSETALFEVKNLLNYFSQSADKYNEFDKLTATLHKLKAGRTGTQKLISRILLVVSVIMFLLLIAIIIYGVVRGGINTNTLGGMAYFLPGFLFLYLGIFSLAGGIALFIVDNSRNNRYMNNLKFYSNRYFELADELYLNYLNYKNCPIKPEFTNPANIFVVQKTLLSGQADSIDEAIALLSNSASSRKIEKHSKQCAQFTQKTAARFGRAKTACKLNAVFLPGNYFSKSY